MGFSREELEQAIAARIGAFGRFDSYELDGDNLTANYTSNSGKMDRQVFIEFDETDGEYSGDMKVSQSEYYPGDSAGWGLAQGIKDALDNPEDYENLLYEDKRIYPSDDDDSEEYESVNGGLVIAVIGAVAGIGYGLFKLGQYGYRKLKEKTQQKNQEQDSTDDNKAEVMVEKDSTVEVIQLASQVANIFKELPEDATLEQFKEAFDKTREVDLRSPFFYVREYKDKFTPEMIEYAQSFYEKEI